MAITHTTHQQIHQSQRAGTPMIRTGLLAISSPGPQPIRRMISRASRLFFSFLERKTIDSFFLTSLSLFSLFLSS